MSEAKKWRLKDLFPRDPDNHDGEDRDSSGRWVENLHCSKGMANPMEIVFIEKVFLPLHYFSTRPLKRDSLHKTRCQLIWLALYLLRIIKHCITRIRYCITFQAIISKTAGSFLFLTNLSILLFEFSIDNIETGRLLY